MNNGEIEKIMIDFTKNGYENVTLFTGRKNGKKAKEIFKISKADSYVFLSKENQVITSSFFLGLLGDELLELFKKTGNINKLIDMVDLSNLNDVSRNECLRAIKRGIVTNELYL